MSKFCSVCAKQKEHIMVGLIVAINALLVLGCSTTLIGQQRLSERWFRMADMNTPHQYHSAVVVDKKIYVVGGSGNAIEFEVFNPETNKWQILPKMPNPRSFLGAATTQKRIYAIGGILGRSGAYANVDAFDLGKNLWVRCADLTTPRNRLAAIAIADRIYAIGGMNNDQDTPAMEVYDPGNDRWEKHPPMPIPRHGHSAVVVSDKILVVGGYRLDGSNVPLARVDEFNPATGQWSQKADMPTPRGFFGLAVAKGYVYAIAGRVRSDPPVERYDPRTNSWTLLGTMPGGFRNRFAIGVVDEMIYVIGGEYQGDRTIPISVLRYEPEFDQ